MTEEIFLEKEDKKKQDLYLDLYALINKIKMENTLLKNPEPEKFNSVLPTLKEEELLKKM